MTKENMEVSALVSPSRRRSQRYGEIAPLARKEIAVGTVEDEVFLRTLEEQLQQHVEELPEVDLVLGAKQINYLAFRLHEALEPKRDPETSVIQAWTIQPQAQIKMKMSSHIQVLKLSTMLREVARLRIHQESLMRSPIEMEIFPSLQTIEIVHTEVTAIRNVHSFARQLRKLRLEHTPLQSLKQILSPTTSDTAPLTLWKKLESLRINCCALPSIDVSFNALEAIKVVDLAWNEIAKFEATARITSLQWLDLCHNKLSTFPPLGQLRDLKILDLSVNQIGSLRGVEELTALVDLDISSNSLRNIGEVELLTSLSQLRRLVIRENPMARRPDYRREVFFYLGDQVELDDEEWTPVEIQTMKSSRRLRLQTSDEGNVAPLWNIASLGEAPAWAKTDVSMVYPVLPMAAKVPTREVEISPPPRFHSPRRRKFIQQQTGRHAVAFTALSRMTTSVEETTTEMTEDQDVSAVADEPFIQTVDNFFRLQHTDQASSNRTKTDNIEISVDGIVDFESDSDTSSERSRNRSRKYTESDFMRDFEEEEAVIAAATTSRDCLSSSLAPTQHKHQTHVIRGIDVRVLLSTEDAAVFDLAFGIDGLAATIEVKSNELVERLHVPDRETCIAFSRQLPDVMAVGTSTQSTRANIVVLKLRKIDHSFKSVTYQLEATAALVRLLTPLLGHLYTTAVGQQTPSACVCSNCGGVSHFSPEFVDVAFASAGESAASIFLYTCLLCASLNVREVSADRMLALYVNEGMPLLAKRIKPTAQQRTQVEVGFSVEEHELSEREALEIHHCVLIAANGIREAVNAHVQG